MRAKALAIAQQPSLDPYDVSFGRCALSKPPKLRVPPTGRTTGRIRKAGVFAYAFDMIRDDLQLWEVISREIWESAP